MGGKKKTNTHKHNRRANSTERVGGGGTRRSKLGRRGVTGGAKNKKNNSEVGEQAGKRHGYPGIGPGGRAPRNLKKEAQHPHERGSEERPVLGARNGPRMDEDPVGPRRRVAGGLVGYKDGKMGKGDGTQRDVWLGPHYRPGSMGSRGARRIGREG